MCGAGCANRYDWASTLTDIPHRFIRQGSIKLEGDEKALMAEYEASTATQDDPKEATFTEIP